MLEFLAATKPVVVQVQEASGGASIESILVFIGGVLAAMGAVAAAIISTRGASSRLEQQLANERERFDKQLVAEAHRVKEQLDHDRHLARRAEASATIERISRTVARTGSRVSAIAIRVLRDKEPNSEELILLQEEVNAIREEVNVVTIRFGGKSAVVGRLLDLVKALQVVTKGLEDLPLTDEGKDELRQALRGLSRANANFLAQAKKELEDY